MPSSSSHSSPRRRQGAAATSRDRPGRKSQDSSGRGEGKRGNGGRGRWAKPREAGERRPGAGWRLFQGLLALGGFVSGTLLLAGLALFLFFDRKAAAYDLRQVARMPLESTVYDIRGREMGYLHGDGRAVVPLDQVAPAFQQALLAREDSRFFSHGGVDPWGLARAALRNLKDREAVQGASTLTMQLARNTYDLREKSIQRKLLEMALARRVEGAYSKEEILRLYVNRIYFGTGLHGIEQAARGYFGKAAAELDLAESAMVAGIIRAPNRFSPYRHPEEALREMRRTLARMVDEGLLGEEEAAAWRQRRPAILSQEAGQRAAGRGARHGRMAQDSHVMEAVRREVDRLVESARRDAGGFEIYTTFDLELQAAAEAAVEKRLTALESEPGYPHPALATFVRRQAGRPGLEPDYLQAAVCVIDNATGAVRALVGGRDYAHSGFNRATQAKRQVGSVFKPLVFATAFETGLFPGSHVNDDPIRPGEVRWHRAPWTPANADGRFLGLLPVSRGLIESRNTMSVRVGERAGIEAVLAMTEHAGLASRDQIDPSPQLYIGNLGATLQALVSAYSCFPNDGFRYQPHFIERIETREREILHEARPQGYRVVSPGAAWLTREILAGALAPGGTGAEVRKLGFREPAGGKTGTTNDYRDAWFIGYASSLTAGVWVGLDQPAKIADRGYGGRLSLPVWTDIMLAARRLGYPCEEMPPAEDLIEVELCRFSGRLAGDACRRLGGAYQESIPQTMIPRAICEDHARALPAPGSEPPPQRSLFDAIKGWLSRG